MLNRREFLQAFSASTLGAAISSLSLAQPMSHSVLAPATATAGFEPDVELELTARVEAVSLLPGQARPLSSGAMSARS